MIRITSKTVAAVMIIQILALGFTPFASAELPSSQTIPNAGTLPSNPQQSSTPNVTTPISSRFSSNSVKGTGVKFAGCYTAGVLTPLMQNLINKGLTELKKKVASIAKEWVSSLLSGFLAGLLNTTIPTDDKAGESAVAYMANRDFQEAVIARCTAWSILDSITQNTLKIVRTGGRDGGATYVQNWTNFQTQAQYRGEGIFRAELGNSQLCDYFANDIKRSYGISPGQKPINLTGQNTRIDSLQTYNQQTRCTMPQNFSMSNYQKDFAGNGGWNTWSRLMQPENNPYGVLFISQEEIQKQRSMQQAADVNQVLANFGYTGISGNGSRDSCQVTGPNNQCLVYKNIKTPGSYIAQNVGQSIGAQLSWLTSAQNVSSILADATEVMLNRMLNLGSSDEGSYRLVNTNDRGFNLTGGGTGTDGGTSPACTATGQAEQDFILGLLNGDSPPSAQSVSDQTNQKFNLTPGNEAVYYADSNTIGLPEFYAAGPTSTRPVSPSTGKPWDIVIRCTGSGTAGGGGGGGGGTGGGTTDNNRN